MEVTSAQASLASSVLVVLTSWFLYRLNEQDLLC